MKKLISINKNDKILINNVNERENYNQKFIKMNINKKQIKNKI